MAWIKRNLVFVAALGGALLLLIGGGVYLFANLSQESQLTEQLNQQVSTWQRLHEKNPSPENIAAAKKEQQRLQQFLARAGQTFIAEKAPPKMTDQQFGIFLANSVRNLQNRAASVGVATQDRYRFSFAALAGSFTFDPNGIEPLIGQVNDISKISAVLFDARVSAIEGLRRVRVSTNDIPDELDYIQTTIVTNQLGVFVPYEVTFRAFSSELALALEGFMRPTNSFIIRTIDVQTTEMPLFEEGGMVEFTPRSRAMPMARPPPRDPRLGGDSRYGEFAEGPSYRSRPAAAPPTYAPPRQRTPGQTQPITVLTEKPLLVTMLIDVVRLQAEPKEAEPPAEPETETGVETPF